MSIAHRVGRPMLAGMFILGGIDALRHPDNKAGKAERVADPLGHPVETPTLVQINGAAQVAAGTMLALGKMPRLASMVLIGSLVPTTYAGHAFWEEEDGATRAQQQIHFLKNVAMLGGLVLSAGASSDKKARSAKKKKHAKDEAEGPGIVGELSELMSTTTRSAGHEAVRDAALAAAALTTAAHRASTVARKNSKALREQSKKNLRKQSKRLRVQERRVGERVSAAAHSPAARHLAHSAAERARRAKLPIAG
jgi:uncharacterized membrane protein YphA (DoxX/SURF4 family)